MSWLNDKNVTIDEQHHMLASHRDIRDLMGARGLYIAEVYDVGGNGKKRSRREASSIPKGNV